MKQITNKAFCKSKIQGMKKKYLQENKSTTKLNTQKIKHNTLFRKCLMSLSFALEQGISCKCFGVCNILLVCFVANGSELGKGRKKSTEICDNGKQPCRHLCHHCLLALTCTDCFQLC